MLQGSHSGHFSCLAPAFPGSKVRSVVSADRLHGVSCWAHASHQVAPNCFMPLGAVVTNLFTPSFVPLCRGGAAEQNLSLLNAFSC